MCKKRQATRVHEFYCLNCGKSVSLPRRIGKGYKKFHRKKLYCPYCQNEVNHVECRDELEAAEFKKRFAAGEFVEEAQASIQRIRDDDIFALLAHA